MTHTSLGPSDHAMHDISTQPNSIESSPLTTHTSPLQIPTPPSSTSSPPPVRFPSSFADFKLPSVRPSGIHNSNIKPNSSTWPSISAHHGSPSFSSSSSSSTGSSMTTMNDSLEGYPLFHPKKHTRKNSTLSLNNHAHDDHLRIINRLPQDRPVPTFPSPAGSSPLVSSPGEGSPTINQPGAFLFGPTPSASSFGTLQPSVRPYPLPFEPLGPSSSLTPQTGSLGLRGPDAEGTVRTDNPSIWTQPQEDARPQSAGSTAMLSPSSTKGRMRSDSPPGIPVLNPNGAEEGKAEASIRAVTRRGSLYPKHIAHTLTAKLLSTELNPSTSEIRSEAQIQRLLASQSSSPTPFRSRSSLSSGPSSIGGGGNGAGPGNRFKPFFVGGRNRFPEDEGDLFDGNPLSEDDTSEDDDLCMEDETSTTDSPVDPINSFGGSSSSSFRQPGQLPALPHQAFRFDNKPSSQYQQPELAKSSVTPMMINPTGRFSSTGPSHLNGDGEGDMGMMAVGSSPVMGSPRRRSGSGSGSGSIGGGSVSGSVPGSGSGVRPVTPGSAGMGWRESGGKKRKVAMDERFDPYASSLAFKRRAVSPSTTLLPPPTSSSYTNTPSFLQQSPMPTLSTLHPNSQSQSQSQTQPIPISLTYYNTSSRHGSPVSMHPQVLSSSAGAGTGRSLGGSAPGYAGPGLGTSLLAREREGRRSSGSGFGTWEDDEAGLSGMKLG